VLIDALFGELEYIDGYQFYARDSPQNILFVCGVVEHCTVSAVRLTLTR
jgi:hypothetical protein